MKKSLKWIGIAIGIVYLVSGLLVLRDYIREREKVPFRGWLYYWDGPYKGKVIDADIGEPIEGAAVVGVAYIGIVAGIKDAMPFFCDAKEAVTDKNGAFILPKISCLNLWPLAGMNKPHFVVFKPGYLSYPPRSMEASAFTGVEFKDKRQQQVIKLKKAITYEERRSTLGLVDISDVKKTPYLLKLINEERRNLGFKD